MSEGKLSDQILADRIALPPSSTPIDEEIADANILTGRYARKITQRVEFYDNTLREGEQAPGVALDPGAKMEIALAMDDLGCHWANVGFPVVSEAERKGVEAIAKRGLRMQTSALCRLRSEDIAMTADTGVQMLALFIGTSDSHLRDKLRMDEDTALKAVSKGISEGKKRGVKVTLGFEDASRTPFDRLLRFIKAVEEAGADGFNIADTMGILTPEPTYQLIQELRSKTKMAVGLHFHNDLGLSLANSLAGLEAGADVVQVTVNGLGERCGNARFDQVAVALRVKYGIDCGIDLKKLVSLSELVSRLCDVPDAQNSPITGPFAFMHESGIHQAGLLASTRTYQPFPPALIGRRHELVFGKHTGTKAISYLAELAEIDLSKDHTAAILGKVKNESERTGELVSPSVVIEWMRELA